MPLMDTAAEQTEKMITWIGAAGSHYKKTAAIELNQPQPLSSTDKQWIYRAVKSHLKGNHYA